MFVMEKPNERSIYVTAYSQAPLSPVTGDAKSTDEEHPNNFNSVNSEEVRVYVNKKIV